MRHALGRRASLSLSLSLFFSKKKDEVQVYCICCGILSHGFWGGKIRGREMGGTRRKESENEAETRAMRDRLEGRAHPGHTTPHHRFPAFLPRRSSRHRQLTAPHPTPRAGAFRGRPRLTHLPRPEPLTPHRLRYRLQPLPPAAPSFCC
jgi:hypothetical protein